MRLAHESIAKILAASLALLVTAAYAQEAAEPKKDAAVEVKKEAVVEKAADEKPKAAETKADPAKPQAAKKMVQDATINLQTTITGNQEQPRVLYILPWQSPQTANVDFEPLDSQQKAVFGHIEREELRRELEAAGELQ